jgi:hypothetical protein
MCLCSYLEDIFDWVAEETLKKFAGKGLNAEYSFRCWIDLDARERRAKVSITEALAPYVT